MLRIALFAAKVGGRKASREVGLYSVGKTGYLVAPG